jgi:type I restriction enzyme S subunit
MGKHLLKDLVQVYSGKGFKKSEYSDNGIRLLKINNVTVNGISWKSIDYLPEAYLEKYPKLKLKSGDILLALNRPILNGQIKVGRLTTSDEPAILYQRVGKFELKNKDVLESSFFLWFLKSPYFISRIQNNVYGSDQPFITNKKLYSIEFPYLPPLPEQRRIVAVLDGLFGKIDRAIALVEENIAHTQALMGSLLDEEFGKAKIKKWKISRFSEIAVLRHGHQFRKYDFVDHGIPVVKIGQCKRDGSLDLSNCNFIESNRLKEFKEDRIYKGDLLMALTGGTLGKVTWVNEDYGDLVQNYRVGNFFNLEGKSTKRFLMYILMSSIFQDLVASKVNQGAQPNIGKQHIDEMLVPVPSLNEQNSLVERFDLVLRNQKLIINQQTQQLASLKALKSSLLDRAFKGKV